MKIRADRLFINEVTERESSYPIIIEDIRTGDQHLVIGRKCFANESEDPDAAWEGNLDAYVARVFLYDDEKDSLEAFYDTLDRGWRKSEFPRVLTKVDQRRRQKADANERRRLKRKKAAQEARSRTRASDAMSANEADESVGLRVVADSESANDAV